ncbi:MAG: hypothetical protein CW342_05055 [Thermoactinomycetaceae bacterium]|nr:hypothetical protein [Bacillota bacterium]MBO2532247.1 hypothetical protein [Thermoactinomycetaceae bacterium]
MGFEELMQLFRYPANWNLPGNLLTVLVGATYLLLVGPLRRLFPGSTPVRPGKKIWFLSGLLLLYFTLGSPLDLLAHELFTFHMLQMSLLYLVIPPFFLNGIPDWMFRAFFRIPGVKPVVSLFTRPIVALFVFNGLLSLYHFPMVFNTALANEWLHDGIHLLLGITALFFWWPITVPLVEMDRLSDLKKLLYIIAGGGLLLPACALIIFADAPMFAIYKDGDAIIPFLSPLHDQQLGGVLMKVTQEISYSIALVVTFFRWVRNERAKERKEQESLSTASTLSGSLSGKPQTNPQ